MSFDHETLRVLLTRAEDNFLDFKVQQYKFDTERQASGFIKDIVSMANTPRNESAYIVIGIDETDGRPTQLVGVNEHIDPSELDRQLQDRVNTVPAFEYHVVEHEGREIGIYEIKLDYSGPFVATRKFGRLNPGAIHFRRNSQNVVATNKQDIDRITQWFNGVDSPVEPQYADSASWQAFYRACDGFDDRRTFIGLIDENLQASDDDWTAFAKLGWGLIIDFDTNTDRTGGYFKANEVLGKIRSLKLTPLDSELPLMGLGASLWVAARGISSRPTTVPNGGWREWHREKLTDLRKVTETIAKNSDVRPTTVIVFGGESSYVRTVCEQVDDNFRDRVSFVFAHPEKNRYSESIETFNGEYVPISFGEACSQIGEFRRSGSETDGIEVPKMEGGVAQIPPDRARWIEEEFDLVHLPNNASIEDTQNEIKGFHQGNEISWYGLNAGIDIHRDGLEEIERRVRDGLASRSVRRVDLPHWPGAGGSTLGRRLAWNLHTSYPAIIAHTVNPGSNLDRIRYLFDISNQPVLVIIDSPSATSNDLDRLFDLVRGSNVWTTLVRVIRHYGDPHGHRPVPFLDAMLSAHEGTALEEKLATFAPDRRSALHRLSDIENRRLRTPFNYGLTAFGRDFQGLESYVRNRLVRCSEEGRLICLVAALVYHYGQMSISLQLFAQRLGIPQTKVVALSDVVDDFVEDLFVTATGKIRPIHELIAEEILRQLLGQDPADENWRTGLADAAITLAEICAEQATVSGAQTYEMLHTVLLERHTEDSDSDFSRLLNDIPSPEGQERVLTRLTELFPYEPHFWAHLGRFRSIVTKNHQMAHECHQTALGLTQDDPTLHHMAGMSLRAQLYDLLQTSDWKSGRDASVRGLVEEAAERFATARQLDRRNEHGYIAHVQMLDRVINTAAIREGLQYQTNEFLVHPRNGWYLRLLDQAEQLLVELTVARGGDSPSGYESNARITLNRIYGNYTKAIEGWTSLLNRSDVYRPPVRRNIINAHLARRQGNWLSLSQRELATVFDLAEKNLAEEPSSDANLRIWFRAARIAGTVSVDRAAETLGIRRLRWATIDTLYYLYILKFLQADEGSLSMTNDAREVMADCRATSVRTAFPRVRTFEWLGKQSGLKALVHISELGEWDNSKKFWSNEYLLRRVPGVVSRIQGPASGEIELPNGLTAFFVPSTVMVEGGFVRGLHEGRQVEFYLGFSYEGLRAWSVGEATANQG